MKMPTFGRLLPSSNAYRTPKRTNTRNGRPETTVRPAIIATRAQQRMRACFSAINSEGEQWTCDAARQLDVQGAKVAAVEAVRIAGKDEHLRR